MGIIIFKFLYNLIRKKFIIILVWGVCLGGDPKGLVTRRRTVPLGTCLGGAHSGRASWGVFPQIPNPTGCRCPVGREEQSPCTGGLQSGLAVQEWELLHQPCHGPRVDLAGVPCPQAPRRPCLSVPASSVCCCPYLTAGQLSSTFAHPCGPQAPIWFPSFHCQVLKEVV